MSQSQYSPGRAQQVSWSPKPHLIIWYVLALSCFYIQSRFPSKWTTGSPLWNLENKFRIKDQELRLSKFNFMKARCFYAATEQQCCRAAFGVEQSSSCIASRNFARTWDQTSLIQKLKLKKWRLSASLDPLLSDAVVCCLFLWHMDTYLIVSTGSNFILKITLLKKSKRKQTKTTPGNQA